MEKSKAIELIQIQKQLLIDLKNSTITDETFKKWRRDTGVVIEQVFGSEGKHLEEYNDISFSPSVYTKDETRQQKINRESFIDGYITAKAFLSSLIEEIEKFWTKDMVQNLLTNPIDNVFQLFDRFRVIARQLQCRHDHRPTINIRDEYDVQDLLHALFKLYFDDIRAEEWTPSYAGGSSRMDFLLKNEQIVIEVKKTRDNLKDKQIGEQLIIDIEKYKSHPDCKKLICFVYDPEGMIGNPVSLENDLSKKEEEFEVCVIIRPKD